MGGKAGASGEVGRGEIPNVLSFFSTHRSNIPLFQYFPSLQHSIRTSARYSNQSSSWDVPAGQSPEFPYNQQVTKMLPVKARKLREYPDRGGPAGGRGERISFSFVGLMDQWHVAKISRDEHNKLLPVGNQNEDCNGGQDKGKDGPGNPFEPYLAYRTRDE